MDISTQNPPTDDVDQASASVPARMAAAIRGFLKLCRRSCIHLWRALTSRPASSLIGPGDIDVFHFDTPSLGDAYDFRISVRCEWADRPSGPHGRRPRFWRRNAALTEARHDVKVRLQDQIRPIIRRIPPYRPAEAEEAVKDAIRESLETEEFICTVTVCVSPAEPVRKQLEEYWLNRMELAMHGDRSEALVEQLRTLRAKWQRFLAEGFETGDDPDRRRVAWLVPDAVTLAENSSDVAGTVRSVMDQRKEAATRLVDDLRDDVSEHDELDLLRFVVHHDTALRRIMDLLGLPLPPADEGTWLHDAADVVGAP